MIKKRSEPKHPHIYARFVSAIFVLNILSWIGNCISGLTEYNGFLSDNIPPDFITTYAVLDVLFIELAWRYLLPRLADTIFDRFRQPESYQVPMILILTIICVGIGIISIRKSKEGIKYKAETDYAFTQRVQVDSTKYLQLCESCRTRYSADTSSAGIRAAAPYADALESAKQEKTKASNRRAALAHVAEDWAVATRTQKYAIIKAKRKEIKRIETDIAASEEANLLVAKSKYDTCMAMANDTLLHCSDMAKNALNTDKNKNIAEKEQKVTTTNYLMYAGVFLVFIFSFFRAWVYYISGIDIEYIHNPVDSAIGFWSKVKELLKTRIHNFGDAFISLTLKHDAKVVDREIRFERADEVDLKKMKKGNHTKNNRGFWSWLFKRGNSSTALLDEEMMAEKEQITQEQERLQREKALEEERLVLEEQRRKIEAEKAEIAQKRKAEAIKLQAEAERRKQEQELELARLKAIQEQQLEAEKQQIKQEQLRLELEQMKREKAELEAKEQLEEERLKEHFKLQVEMERMRMEKEEAERRMRYENELELKRLKEEQEARIRKQVLEEQKQALKDRKKQQEVLETDLKEAQKIKEEQVVLEKEKQVLETDLEHLETVINRDLEPVSEQLETDQETDPQSVSVSVSDAQSIGEQVNITLLFSENYLKKVRNWYKASKGIGNRGKTETARNRNRLKYETAKKQLEKIGVQVVETDKTVRFVLPK